MASIREIASNCNVSSSTVSRVLNQDTTLSVSNDVRRRIEEEAARLGYRTPRQKRSDLILDISIALAPFDKPGFEERLIAYLQQLSGPDFNIHHFDRSQNVDGIIAIGEFSRDEVMDYEKVSSNLLMINNLGTSYSHDSIMMDYAHSEENVVRMFRDMGLVKVGYLGGTYVRSGHVIGQNRAEHFRQLLRRYCMLDEACIPSGGLDEESGYNAVMALERIPQGLIFGDSDYARGAFRALDERGENPETVTYVNFFSEDVVRGHSLLIFSDDILRTALKLLREKIRKERTQSYNIYAESLLI